jgi:PAS domain S-box-containing protein
VFFGLILLVISDAVFPILISDPERLRELQALKGALEVLASGAVIYVLVVRSQQELRETNALLKGVLDASPLAILAADREGNTTVWGGGAEEMYGWSEVEAVGEPAPNVPEEHWEDFEYLRERMFDEETAVVGHETVRQTKDGSRIDVSITTGPMTDEEGDVFGIMAVQEDITERKARERELERLNRIIEQLPVGVFRATLDGQFVDMNDEFVSLLDAESKEALMERDPRSLYADPSERDELISSLREEGAVADREVEITTVTGDRKWVSTTLQITEKEGEQYLEGISMDVTERKERERELRETRQRLQAIIDAAPLGILAVDEDGTTQLWNPGCERIFGWTEEEALGEPLPNVHEAKADEFDELRERMIKEEEPVVGYETVRQTKDGTLIDVALTTAPIRDATDDIVGVMGILEDITDRKKRERELREEREQFEKVLDTSPVGITILDADGRIERANDRAEDILGLESSEITSRTYDDPDWDILDENGDPIPREELPFSRVMQTGEPVYDAEHGIETAGTRRWLSVNAAPLSMTNGEVERVVAAVEDITDRREREQELRRSEQRYRNLIENAPVGINLFHEDGEIVWGNDVVVDLLGLDSQDDLIGRSIFEFIHPDDHEVAETEFEEVLSGDAVVGPTNFRIVRPDGEHRYVRVKKTAGWYEGDRVGQAVVVDVTELRETEMELRENEQRYRTVVEMSPVPIFVHKDGGLVYTNEAMVDLVDAVDQSELLGTSVAQYVDTDEHGDVLEVVEQTQRGERSPTSRPYTVVTLDGETRHVETTSRPIAYEGDAAVLTIAKDVTSQHEYEQALQSLRETARRMLLSDTADDAAETAVDAATSLLDLSGTVVYRLDSDEGCLRPIASSTSVDVELDEIPSVSGQDGGPLWEAFATGERDIVDANQSDDASGLNAPSQRLLVVPFGTHGLLVIGSTNEELPQTTLDLVSVLADNLETTFDRFEKERQLRTQERRLAEQNRELTRLNQLNGVIRSINQALIRATSREEIERAVCDELVDATSVIGAWIGTFDSVDGTLRPGPVRGLDDEHLDRLLAAADGPMTGLARTVMSENEVRTAGDLIDDRAWDGHRRLVLTAGYSAVVAVPIEVRDTVERVLFLHLSDDTLFRSGIAAFRELGQLVGSTIETVGNRRALLTDRSLQVDLTVADESFVFNRLTSRTGHELSVRGVIPRDDGSVVAFLTTEAPAADVRSFVDDAHAIADVTVLSENDDEPTLFEVEMTASLFDVLTKYDSDLQSLTAAEGTTAITVDLPEGVRVREFVEELRTRYDSVELTARRERTDSVETVGTFRAAFEARCTDRQFEALETAHYGGFYEWPRQSNNADLAEALDISSPTYQAHRRTAERKLVEAVFE